MKFTIKDTLCDLSWNYPIVNFGRGEIRTCCRTPAEKITDQMIDCYQEDVISNTPKQKERRVSLMRGLKHADCSSCWKIEENGGKSPRHDVEKFFPIAQTKGLLNLENPTIEELESIIQDHDKENKLSVSEEPYMLEISMGNTCDMKCMYCSHHYSTQWAVEKIKFGEISQAQYDREFPKAPDRFIEMFWKWFESTGVKSLNRIGIIGGEPLIMPELYPLLDRFIEVYQNYSEKHKQVNLWIVTNLNTPPKYLKKLFEYIPKLSTVFNVEILVSMEALGPKAEYIRNGLDWNRFESNIHNLLSNKFEIEFGFIMSLNALSITDLPNFLKFAKGLNDKYDIPISLKHNVITYPSWQSPTILTRDFSKYVVEAIYYILSVHKTIHRVNDVWGQWDKYIEFLLGIKKMIEKEDNALLQDRKTFVSWFDTYDKRRNLNLLNTFPEYAEFYNFCKKL